MAAASVEEVGVTGADGRYRARGSPWLKGSGEDPAGVWQAGVGGGCHAHPAGSRHVVRAVMVHETPGTNHAAFFGRKKTAHGHGAQAAQRNGPGLKKFHGFSLTRAEN